MLGTCLFVRPALRLGAYFTAWFLCSKRAHRKTHSRSSIHGEHPRLQWVTPGYANSLPRAPPHSAAWFPHRRHLEPIGGRVTPSHKALKGSQTHHGSNVKQCWPDRLPTDTMHLEPERTPAIIFYPVRLSVRNCEPFLPAPLKHHLGMSPGRIFTFLSLHGIGADVEQS